MYHNPHFPPCQSSDLGTRLLVRLHQTDAELGEAKRRLEAERREREASVSLLESNLHKLRDEHAAAKVRPVQGGLKIG